jgi:hypothetical protein
LLLLLLFEEPPTVTELDPLLLELCFFGVLLVELLALLFESSSEEEFSLDEVSVFDVDVESVLVPAELSMRAAVVALCARTLKPRTPAVARPATLDIATRDRRRSRSRSRPVLGHGWGVVGSFVMGTTVDGHS